MFEVLDPKLIAILFDLYLYAVIIVGAIFSIWAGILIARELFGRKKKGA